MNCKAGMNGFIHPEMTALRTAINQLDLKDHVRLIPEREDILQIMEFADLGIVSSIDSEVISSWVGPIPPVVNT